MNIKKNEGHRDQRTRAVLGTALFISSLYVMNMAFKIIMYALGLVLIITAFVGFSPLYWLIEVDTSGANSNKNNKEHKKRSLRK